MQWIISDAMATDSATTSGQTLPDSNPYQFSSEKMMTDNLLVLGLLFFIFYFILIRPQQKKIKAHQAMMKSLAKGNKVMTSGGIIGTIAKLEEDVIVLEVAQGIKIRIARGAISEVISTTSTGESANDN